MKTRYEELDECLTGRNRERRKVGNNTYAERRGSHSIAIRLHATDVVTLWSDGVLVLESGGRRTVTTKERINRYLPDGFLLYSNRGIWQLQTPSADVLEFADGMTISPDGTVQGYALPNPYADKVLRKAVSDYVKLCVEAVPLELPNGGDCWYCFLRGSDGVPMGERFRNTTHLTDHFKEGYVVPSLVWRAMESCGYDPKRNIQFSLVFNKELNAAVDGSLAKDTVKRCVRRYLMRQFGYQV